MGYTEQEMSASKLASKEYPARKRLVILREKQIILSLEYSLEGWVLFRFSYSIGYNLIEIEHDVRDSIVHSSGILLKEKEKTDVAL